MGINSTLYTAVTGLNAASVGINNASNNLANAHVKGYSRRVVKFASAGYQDTGVGYIGSGVKVSSIDRVKDNFLDTSIRTETSKYQTTAGQLESLEYFEAIINEPSDVAVSAHMREMFGAFDELSADPTNSTMIENVRQRTQMFANVVNEITPSIDSTINDNNISISSLVSEGQIYTDELATLNNQIAALAQTKSAPNELLDIRDNFLSSLSEIAEIDVRYNADETVSVSVVNQDGSLTEVVGATPTAFNTLSTTDFRNGKITALHEANTKLTGYKDDFNSMVKTLADDINAVHNTNGGGVLFTYTAGSEAATLTVATDIQDGTRRLNVGDPLKPADGSLARQIADFRINAMSNGKIPQEDYNEMLVTLGTDINGLRNATNAKESVLNQLEIKRESLEGVSIDEETVDLMTYQTAYEANARVMSVVQEMMDTLLGMFR